MPQAKKRTSTKRKGNKKTNKKKQNETPLRYIFSIIVVILIILGAFQLGIIGRMIDSFFNYLFGMSRYLTYILVLIATIFITYSKQIPRTRRSIGAIVLQLALLFITQLYFHFSHNITSQREPVLSFVYKAYEQTHFPNFGGGLIGFYLLKLFIPLISIVGVIIITILLLASSFILLLNLRHRDVTKSLFDNLKSSSNHASESIKQKREQNKIKKEEKAQLKEEKIEKITSK